MRRFRAVVPPAHLTVGRDQRFLLQRPRVSKPCHIVRHCLTGAIHVDRSAKRSRTSRGWFPLEGELTSGVPDRKEGLYLGVDLPPEHPRVRAGWPLHGANLWPHEVPELRGAVDAYMSATIKAAHALMQGIALALGLDPEYFARTYTAEPTVLFRIFRYPPQRAVDEQ